MPNDQLATYLNDHLAGSVVAIRLMESLEELYGDSEPTREIARAVRDVRHEVEEDRTVLEGIIARVGAGEQPLRKVTGWVVERAAQAKLALEGDSDGAFRMLEFTEVVALGILGKRSLWRALQAIAVRVPALDGIDYDALVERAESQYERIELLRLGAARAALSDPH